MPKAIRPGLISIIRGLLMGTQTLNQNAKRIADLGLQFDRSDIGNMERFLTQHLFEFPPVPPSFIGG